jgi:putative ABC transport system substrate-binding protein
MVSLALVVALLSSARVEAQQARTIHQIGIVWGTFPHVSRVLFEPLREGLRELGYVEGRNIVFQQRWAEGKPERVPEFIASFVRLNVDVIVVPVNPIIAAAKQATMTIPIVMLYASDPVGAGFVASLAKPGGNITGLSLDPAPGVFAKSLELLKEVSPHISDLILLFDPTSPGLAPYLRAIEDAARTRAIALRRQDVRTPREIDTALAAIRVDDRSALLVFGDPTTFATRSQIAQWALKNRLPAASSFKEFAESGGLIAYGTNLQNLSRRAATYVDRILKGAKPADLPVEQPTKFELVVNLKTAKALGLTIPSSLMLRADRVIE